MDAENWLAAWRPPVGISSMCALTLAVYLRGFFLIRRTRPSFAPWRAVSFTAGVSVLWLALASPLEELADTLLTAHMIEHLLLMSAVPPLVLMGWPTVPLLRGLPAIVRRWTVAPLLRMRPLHWMAHTAVRPVFAWIAMNATLLLWHIPAAYDFALEHELWHDAEHVCFLGTSLLFWWVLLRPWPAQSQPLGWSALPYLIGADFVNTALSAVLAFIGYPVYPFYVEHANPLGLSPLTDQAIGASIMWVFGSVAFLVPALFLLARLLAGGTGDFARKPKQSEAAAATQNARILRPMNLR